jgi:RimJ/RimL family protein N-acetyltransferase
VPDDGALVAYALPEDPASRVLLARLDFRDVGTLIKHLQLDNSWHDVVLTERLVLAGRKSQPSMPAA